MGAVASAAEPTTSAADVICLPRKAATSIGLFWGLAGGAAGMSAGALFATLMLRRARPYPEDDEF